MRLFHHLGLGVWSFLASPAAGLMEGARGGRPQHFAAGVARGARALVGNTVYGLSNAAAKMSGAARKVCARRALPLIYHDEALLGSSVSRAHRRVP